MYNIDINKVEKGITHAGKFHADDVFSTALLRLLNPNIQFIRVNKVLGIGGPEEDSTIVYDIGLGRFDHHQQDSECREDGTMFAAFGLLWREFGHYITSEAGVKKFDNEFVSVLDKVDNTVTKNTISLTVDSFMPDFDEDNSPKNINECFWKAVDFAESVLTTNFKRLKATDRGNVEVKKALDEISSSIVILDRYIPFEDILTPSDAVFVIYPSLRGGYSAHAIKDASGNLKCSFPWRGFYKEALQEVSPGLTFCHSSGFMLSGENIDCLRIACGKAMLSAVYLHSLLTTK